MPIVGDHFISRRIGETRGVMITGLHRSPPATAPSAPIWPALVPAA
ncbi:Hypothetical protein A7982_04204 [Minicystis rosea]|nr:Hypothetical protein A7982_04204 [Minicystis rosea]